MIAKNIKKGLFWGCVAGVFNNIPAVVDGTPWNGGYLPIFFFWITAGFLIATSSLPLVGWKKGVLITFFLFLPIAGAIVSVQSPSVMIPFFKLILVFGYGLGSMVG